MAKSRGGEGAGGKGLLDLRLFASAAEILLAGAKGYEHNMFKIELAKQSVVRALTLAAQGTAGGTTEGAQA